VHVSNPLQDLRAADRSHGCRYVSGDSAVPPTLAILLRLLLAGKLSTDDIAQANS
jgi:hypothetical protein